MGRHEAAARWSVPGYTVQALVGSGGSAEVWRGTDTATGEPVALKRLWAADPEASARLRRESAALSRLDHPHILRLRDTVRQGDEWVLVLDLAEGGSLQDLLAARGRLRPGEVVTVIAPIAGALAHAHAAGMVHGDVSPSNVLLTGHGAPVLSDLGVARAVGEFGAPSATAAYLDPAVAAGGLPSPAGDVFALAAIAFRALTGIPPWNAATDEDTVTVAGHGALPDLRTLAPEAPEELIALLLQAMDDDPGRRPPALQFSMRVRYACVAEPLALPSGAITAVPRFARASPATSPVTGRPRPEPGIPARLPVPPSTRPTLAATARRLVGRRAVLSALVVAAVLGLAVKLGFAWAATPRSGQVRRPAAAVVSASPSPAAHSTSPSSLVHSTSPSPAVNSASPSPAVHSTGATRPAARGTSPPVTSYQGHAPESASPRSASRPSTQLSASTPPAPVGGASGLPHRRTVPPSPQASTRGGATPPASWQAVLERLDSSRSSAYATADQARLAAVYTPGSAALRTDETQLRTLRSRGERVDQVRHQIIAVSAVDAAPSAVTVQATESLTGYTLSSAGGTTRVPSSPPHRYRIVLAQDSQGWRIASIDSTEGQP